MKKTLRMLSLLIAVAMICSVVFVLAACKPKEFTVTYQDMEGKVVGTEVVANGGFATGKVKGYLLIGSIYGADGKVFPLDTPIEADTTLKANFIVNNTWLDENEKNYTWRAAPTAIPSDWNVHTYQDNTATYILDYTSDALYTFDYNATGDGFEIVPSMAAEMPIDVSDEYAEKFGYDEGLVGKAYKIVLKDNLKYDNGEVINAHSFVASAKNLLNPKAANSRASEFYATGDLKIVGAESYVKQGNITAYAINSKYDGFNAAVEAGETILFSLDVINATLFSWFGGDPDADYSNKSYYNAMKGSFNIYTGEEGSRTATGENFLVKWFDPQLEKLKDENGDIEKDYTETGWTAEEIAQMFADYANCDDWNPDAEAELASLLGLPVENPAFNWSDVGFFAASDLELVVVLIDEIEPGFDLNYNLCTHFFLVNNKIYESCIGESSGVYKNSYATSIATYSGYGPYMLSEYVNSNSFKLVRNPYWHGYYEQELKGQYQTTAIQYTVVDNDETRLQMFLAGQIDSYGLREEDMEKYGASKYTYYDDSESTWFIGMNPDADNLAETAKLATPKTAGNTVIKQPLDIDEFRQAMSFSLDRAAFCLALSPTSSAGKSALSSMIVYDPELGYTYRSTEEAKDAILEFWDLSDKWGEGKEYATKDDAIDSITGYDPAGAKVLFETAYEKAVELGYIPEGDAWELQICVGASNWSLSFYSDGYLFLEQNWVAAVKGTPWEGHVTFVQSEDLGNPGFANALRAGEIDLLFGVGWGGSMFDPYSMLNCFVRENLLYDSFTDKTKVMVDIEIDGKVLRASLQAWLGDCIMGKEIQATVLDAEGNPTDEKVEVNAGINADSSLRLKVLAKCEVACLRLWNMIPLMTDASASMRCMRVVYKTEEYLLGLGRGGIQYYTYTMTDEEFAAFVQQQGGFLDYTVTE